MSWSRFFFTRRLAATIALAAVTAACSGRGDVCEQCGRVECRNLSFDVRYQDGKVTKTCCPRCALHLLAGPHPPVASLAVRDFDTASRLDATRAFYVEGSDVTPCFHSTGAPPQDERGCCMKTVYDRCLPSVLAFETRLKAESFARAHGGDVKTFADLKTAIH